MYEGIVAMDCTLAFLCILDLELVQYTLSSETDFFFLPPSLLGVGSPHLYLLYLGRFSGTQTGIFLLSNVKFNSHFSGFLQDYLSS